jgi:hypothetical protein
MTTYNVAQLTEIIVTPSDVSGKVEDVTSQLGKLISEGYEILVAVPFSTDRVAGVKYILKKTIIVEESKDGKTN